MNTSYSVAVKFAAEDKLTRTLNDLITKSRQLEERLSAIPKSLSQAIAMCQKMNDAVGKVGKNTGIYSLINSLKESDKLFGTTALTAIKLGESMKAVGSAADMTPANQGIMEYQRLLASTKGELSGIVRLQQQIQKGVKLPKTTIPGQTGAGKSGSGSHSGHEDGINNLMTAYAGFEFLGSSYDKGIEYARDEARLRQMGLNKSQMAEASRFVNGLNMPYTSKVDAMRIFTDAQGSFRQSGMGGERALEAAKTMTPLLANYEAAMGALSGDSKAAASYNMRNLNKIVEILGGTNPGQQARAKSIVDSVFKTSQSSGRMVDEAQLKLFYSHGGPAVTGQSLNAVFAGLEPIIGELGGDKTSTGMLTAYNRMTGTMSLPPKILLRELKRLGIADKTGRAENQTLWNLQATDVIAYSRKLMEIYKAHGITTQTARERENAILLGRSGATVYNRIMAQMATLEESEKSYAISHGVETTANSPENKMIMSRQKLDSKWTNFQLALAQDGGVLDMATKGIDKLTNGLNHLTAWVKENPNAARYITETGTGMIGLAGAGGALWMLGGALKGLTMPFRVANKSASWLAKIMPDAAKGLWSFAENAPSAARGIGSLYSRIATLNAADGLPLAISRFGLFGGVITAIGLEAWGVYELYKNFKPNDKTRAQAAEVSKGSAQFNITNPNALNDYRHLLNPSLYPAPVPPVYQPNVPIEVHVHLDDKEISNHVIKTVVKQASRAPTGTSGVDTTMTLIHAGMSSMVAR